MTGALDESQALVGLAGDWECNSMWARRSLRRFAEHEVTTVFHLGDFSVFSNPRGRQYLSEVEGVCRGLGVTIFLTPGNHEDHRLLRSLPIDEHGLAWVTDHLAVLARGYRWTMGNATFVSLGGAPSVDFARRIEGTTWWPEEMVTDADVARVAAGGHADIMLAHDAPAPATPAVNRIVLGGGRGHWGRRGRDYAALGRARMTRAFQAIRPRLFAHGHYHVHDEAVVDLGAGHECQMLSLNADNRRGNLALLDLRDGGNANADGRPAISHRWL